MRNCFRNLNIFVFVRAKRLKENKNTNEKGFGNSIAA
jgi:hypothetical protein